MPFPHLFEFMDQAWVPASLRSTLREILECGNALPFRPYYRWVADEVERAAREEGFHTLVELGAGTAPITRHIAEKLGVDQFRLVPCDVNPDCASYRLLEERHPGTVTPMYTSVDFSKPGRWSPDTLLFLSATFHHIPLSGRAAVLESLSRSARRVLIFEPLKRTLSSILFVHLSILPALILPLWYIARPGKLRRFLWCWVLPLAPIMFWWDGIVSCIRQWGEREWRAAADRLGVEMRIISNKSLFSYMVII
jgi:hypothetical protein